jgi:hypothetical protein
MSILETLHLALERETVWARGGNISAGFIGSGRHLLAVGEGGGPERAFLLDLEGTVLVAVMVSMVSGDGGMYYPLTSLNVI